MREHLIDSEIRAKIVEQFKGSLGHIYIMQLETTNVKEDGVIRLYSRIYFRKSSGIHNLHARVIKDAMLAIPNVI